MSVKTRIESLEKRLAKPEPEETVVKVRIITVESREEVEQLRAAGLMDPRRTTAGRLHVAPCAWSRNT